MIVGGYNLHLYCKYSSIDGSIIPASQQHQTWNDKGAMEFYGQTSIECSKQAKKHGWHFKDNNCICKKCWEKGLR